MNNSSHLPKSYNKEIFENLNKGKTVVLKFTTKEEGRLKKRLEFLNKRLKEFSNEDDFPLDLKNEYKSIQVKLSRFEKVALFKAETLFENDDKNIVLSICDAINLKYWFANIEKESEENPIINNPEIEEGKEIITLFEYINRFSKLNVNDNNYSYKEKIIDTILELPNSDFKNQVIYGLINYYEKFNHSKFNNYKGLIYELGKLNKTSDIEINPHPLFFKDLETFKIFNIYIKKHKLNPYKDLSFLFHKLNLEHRLLTTTHLRFAKFMLDNKFINEKEYDTISNKKGFCSRSDSDNRLNNYILILEELNIE